MLRPHLFTYVELGMHIGHRHFPRLALNFILHVEPPRDDIAALR